MRPAVRRLAGDRTRDREWLVTNGLGGYAAGTVRGAPARRDHGLLVAALPAPLGRVLLVSHLDEGLVSPGVTQRLEGPGLLAPLAGADPGVLEEFRLEDGLPVWRYGGRRFALERRVVASHFQNTTWVLYDLLHADDALALEVRPWLRFRPHEQAVSVEGAGPYAVSALGPRVELRASEALPTLRVRAAPGDWELRLDGGSRQELHYPIEAERGDPARGALWSPGVLRARFGSADGRRTRRLALAFSTEPWSAVEALDAGMALDAERERRSALVSAAHLDPQDLVARELVLAADAFVVEPATRPVQTARARAAGGEARTVIAGYPWFTDWGRDTMIALEGLTLCTGRHREAVRMLRTFLGALRDGLVPNLYPEGRDEGLYHTADATLWLFHALDRTVEATGDRDLLRAVLPSLRDVVIHHVRGTHFGIGVDPEDGLLRQGTPDLPLTWMDAKVGDWVVTPRRGKAVEINALWYNALRLLQGWCEEEDVPGADPAELAKHADRTRESFNGRFWYEDGGYLYDVVDGEDGDDAALRPNQVFALALRHPVLDVARWKPVIARVEAELLTPVGLRSLAPGSSDYRSHYFGDLHARDAAYHQGTVWGWLIGPFVDAWLRVHPDERARARDFLAGLVAHLDLGCIGTVSEIFDAEAPFAPRGCYAQAWSVAELLRTWRLTAPRSATP